MARSILGARLRAPAFVLALYAGLASATATDVYWHQEFPPTDTLDGWEFRFSEDLETWGPASLNGPPEIDPDGRMAVVVTPGPGFVELRSVLDGVPSAWSEPIAVPEPPGASPLAVGLLLLAACWPPRKTQVVDFETESRRVPRFESGRRLQNRRKIK